jgi:hypothetical protein
VDAFGIALISLALVAVVVAAVSYWGSGRAYGEIGSGGLSMEHEQESASTPAEAREEIRQMLEAKSSRRVARGEPALDVEAELEALTRTLGSEDRGLRDEVRQLVVASNERRVRQGREPLDVEAETERRLRALGG